VFIKGYLSPTNGTVWSTLNKKAEKDFSTAMKDN